jgi:predicted site-specific integrase-resolvase
MKEADLVGSSEARAILGDIDRSTLVRWVQLGKLAPAQKLPGPNGAYLFRRSDVEALRDARAKTSEDEPDGSQVA